MKAILYIGICLFFVRCHTEKTIQLHAVSVQLIKIDTVYRYPVREQVLTWRTEDGTKYVSYEELNKPYVIGTRFMVMMKR